jgi:hypothetical protein
MERSFFPTLPDLVMEWAVQSAFHERAAAATRDVFGGSVFIWAVITAEGLTISTRRLAEHFRSGAASTVTLSREAVVV